MSLTSTTPAFSSLKLYPLRRHIIKASVVGLAAIASAVAAPDYSRDIKPILSENGFSRHAFDEKERKGKLRLDLA